MQSFKWESLEEGKFPEMTKKAKNFIKKHWKRSVMTKCYTVYILLYMFIVMIRPSQDHGTLNRVILMPAEKSTIDHTGIYVNMKSRQIDHVDEHIKALAVRLKNVSEEKHYACLAGIHLGYPMRIIYIEISFFFQGNLNDRS